jgi:hypothetical protein
MKIAVLSDTHITSFDDIPQKVIDYLSTMDLIVHAGDFVTRDVLEGLKKLGKVTAVRGNMDSSELRNLLPEKEIIEVGSKRIGVTHGWGAPLRMEHKVKSVFTGEKLDAIIFGHSHFSQNKVIDGILFFNPGKASRSFGILTVEEDIKGEIISSKT